MVSPVAPPDIPLQLTARLRSSWVALLFIVVLGWFDWLMHRSLFFLVVVGGLVVAAVLYRAELVRRLGIAEMLGQLPPWGRALLRASPAMLYFVVRGSGTSGAGGIVLTTMVTIVAVLGFFGRAIDARLSRWYTTRDKLLPRGVRLVCALVLSIITAFGVVHGALSDLPALVGGTTLSRQSPIGISWRFVVALLMVAVITTLLMRERER